MTVATTPDSVSMQCPSCSGTTDATAGICGLCGFQLTSEVSSRPRVAVSRARIPVTAHLHYLVDTTGSTAVCADNITAFTQCCEKLVGAKAAKLVASVYSCGDLDYGEQTVSLAQAVSPAEAEAKIKSLVYSGGGDAEETHLDSIQTVLSWIPPGQHTERHSLICFFTDGSKPLRSGGTPRELGLLAKSQGVFPVLVCQPCAMLQEFLDASGGLMYEITRAPTETEVAEIAAKVAASVVASLVAGRKTTTRPNA